MTAIRRGPLVAYAFVALPLAAGALPLYINVASVYADGLGAQLTGVGVALLVARAADAFLDPYLGAWIDRLRRPRLVIVGGMSLLALGLLLVFHPPWTGTASIAWLPLALLPAYLGHSSAAIAHLALGAEFGDTSAERVQIAVWREGFALAGILLATVAPQWIAADIASALARGSVAFAALAPLGVAAVLLYVRPSSRQGLGPNALPWLETVRAFSRAPFLPLLAAFTLNGVANALAATLVLFFVADVLGAEQSGSLFLLAYFAAGAIGLPAWPALAARLGTQNAWRLSMLLGAAAFVGAALLGPGDLVPFFAVCIATGLVLGGDLALPAALLTDTLRQRGEATRAAGYFGVWTFATKMSAAAAAGVGLPLIEALGYLPGRPETAFALQAVYCLLPCALKIVAACIVPVSVRTGTQGVLP